MANSKRQLEVDLADGNTFWEIIRSSRCNDERLTHRLESTLSDHKRRCVRQVVRHKAFCHAFNKLSRIPGIRPGLLIGNLHKLITLRCDEEILNYLEHIYNTWLRIAGGIESNLERIDVFTVQILEHKCPRYSMEDERALQNIVLNGHAFTSFDRSDRLVTWKTLCSIDFTIPSLSTFGKDVKYLEKCAKWMKRLVSMPQEGHTVQTALSNSFQQSTKEDKQYPVENSDSSFSLLSVEAEARFQLGLRQLWLYSMRNFRELEINPNKLLEFARLASKLGFDTSKIHSLNSLSTDLEAARQALPTARPPQDYNKYDDLDCQVVVQKIAYSFLDSQRSVLDQKFADFVTDKRNLRKNFRPWLNQMSYADTAEWLFIDVMDQQPSAKGENITDLFRLRSTYKAFFYEPAFDSTSSTKQPPIASNDSHSKHEVVPAELTKLQGKGISRHTDNQQEAEGSQYNKPNNQQGEISEGAEPNILGSLWRLLRR